MIEELMNHAIYEGAVVIRGGPENSIYSIDPPETLFGYTYYSHLVPPLKPETVLILGYGTGTVAKLIYKIWGKDIKITGVDIVSHDTGILEVPTFLVKQDALKYVESAAMGLLKRRFDYVIVDVWDGRHVPNWIFANSTAKMLSKITKKFISFNVLREEAESLQLYVAHGFKYDRSDIIDDNACLFFSKEEKE